MSAEEQQQGNEQQAQERRGRRGGRGFGRGRGGRGRRQGGRGKDEEEWVPVTNLGRLVAAGIIKKLEDIYVHSIPIKEYQIVDTLTAKNPLKEECMGLKSVQKQTKAGQRTRFKAVVCTGDENGVNIFIINFYY